LLVDNCTDDSAAWEMEILERRVENLGTGLDLNLENFGVAAFNRGQGNNVAATGKLEDCACS